MSKDTAIDTTAEVLSDETVTDTVVDNAPPTIPDDLAIPLDHAYGCMADRCVPECPHALAMMSDTELEQMARDAHQIGAWTLQFLCDDKGPEDEGLIARGLRLFGNKG